MDDLTHLIPPEWLALAHEWAPSVLAVLLATTAIVHLLLPIARAVERWAITTPAAWDDSAARRAVEILEWLASATVAILAFLPRLAVGRLAPAPTRPRGTLAEPYPPLPPPPPDPPSGALGLVLLVVAAACSVATSGCGMTAVDAGRHGLAGTARLSAQLDRDLAAERLRVAAEIRANPTATRAEHDAAMAPFDELLEITVDLRDAHLAAESALDATEHGQAREWRPLITCVFSATARLVGIAARRVSVPPEAGEVLQLLAGLAEGACPRTRARPEPEDEPASDEPAAEEGGTR